MLPTPSMSASTLLPLNSVSSTSSSHLPASSTMVLPASSALVLPTVGNGAKVADQIYSEADVDICEVVENLQESKFLVTGEPNTMVDKQSQQKEKQISVDPISLKELSVRDESSNLVLPPAITVPKLSFSTIHLPISPSPAKPKLLSFSLPNSAASSPRFSTSVLKKKWRNQCQASPRHVDGSPNHSNSPVPSHRESQLRRSKSCGEGRACAPSDEFDLWLNGANIDGGYHDRFYSGLATTQTEGSKDERKRGKKVDPQEDGFKCGALCLFLPGFGRGKPLRARKEEAEVTNVISRTVSLEKFECASWASSAIVNSNIEEDGDSMNLYFDLPLELIRTSVNDANSPVAAAFVFDKNTKGVLKNSMGRTAGARKSQESSRHVRFSTSTPTSYPASPSSCITPRLRKAREDFNAYLEAQS